MKAPWALALCVAWPAAQAADPPPPSATRVESIVVEAQRLSVENLIDRKVYSIAPDVQSTFGTLSEVLTAIPSVDVDPEGNVSLRGDANVVILIDGKPAPQFSGAAAGDNLQSLSAANIERIEVITTPPAQFKAEGASGVINIITRKEHPDGFAGSVQGGLGNGGRAVAGASTSYSAGPLAVSASAGFRHDLRQRRIASAVRVPGAPAGQATDSTSVLDETVHRQVPSAELSSEYTLDERRTISGSASWSERGGLRTYTQVNDGYSAAGSLVSADQRMSRGHDPEQDVDARLGYSQKLLREGEKLELALQRSTSRQREHYDYTNDAFVPPAPTSFNNLALLEDRATSDLSADYSLPLSKSRSLKLGYGFEQEDFRYGNAGNNVDPVTRNQVVDPSVTNDFGYRQQIHSGYASYQDSTGRWNWLAGLRGELTRTRSEQFTQGIFGSGGYFSAYPSLHVDRSLSDEATLSFGASRRVSRPDPSNLDPYVDHEYTPNLRAGNAGLRPQTTQSYEVGYGIEGHGRAYQLTGYLRRNRDSVTDVTQYLGNGISLATKANLPRNDAAGLEFTANGHIVPMLGFSASGNLFHSQIDATALGTPGLRSTTGINAKLKFDLRPTPADSVQLTVNRTDRRLTPQGTVSALNTVSAGYRHQVRTGLAATATVSDIFNGLHYERQLATPTFTGDYQRSLRGRVLTVGLVYSFGSTKQKKPANLEFDQSD